MRTLLTILAAVIVTAGVWAQSPQGMSYQAVIRDAGNNLVTGHTIGMRVSILQGSAVGTEVYKEIYNPYPQTNANGLVTVIIGSGIPVAGTFAGIDWANGPYFIKTETDPSGGTNYTIAGTSQLLSVPYALHARTSETLAGGINETDPIFGVSPAKGISSSDITSWNTVFGWGNHATKGYLTSEVDGSITNEIQNLTISGNNLTLSNGGGSIVLPSAGDNWGSQIALTDATITGNGTASFPLKIARQGAATGQVLKWSGSDWSPGADNSGWQITGNTGTSSVSNFLGTTDNTPLKFRTNNAMSGILDPVMDNTGFGKQALNAISAGTCNTAIGSLAMGNTSIGGFNVAVGYKSAYQNTEGISNVAIGVDALGKNTTGNNNVAVGRQASFSNTTGFSNVAIGKNALHLNNINSNLVAVGDSALFNNGFGGAGTWEATCNTAIGSKALFSNSTGNWNTSIGYQALYANTTGNSNVGNGYQSLYSNTTGSYNTAVGAWSLKGSDKGFGNTAIGYISLSNNGSGNSNIAIGEGALVSNTSANGNVGIGNYINQWLNADLNTCIGNGIGQQNTYYDQSTFLGAYAGPVHDHITLYSNCMALGYNAHVDSPNKAVIGNTSVSSIGGYVGWTTYPSDKRYKKNIRENVPGLEFIKQLRPVTYTLDINALNADLEKNEPTTLRKGELPRKKTAADIAGIAAKEKIVYTGFIAQDVEAVAKKIGYDFIGVDVPQNTDGQYGLRYAEFVVPLVKGMQEQQAIIEELEKMIVQLQFRVQQLERRKNVK